MSKEKQYILKPGNHQFAPGSHAIHNNDNTSDEEAAFYLKHYPHIKGMFQKLPDDKPKGKPAKVKEVPETIPEATNQDNQISEITS